jgi:hypothetical protein
LSGDAGLEQTLGDGVGVQDDLVVVGGDGFEHGGWVVVVVDVCGDAKGKDFGAAQDGAVIEELGATAVEGAPGEECFLEDLSVGLGGMVGVILEAR